jgi:glucokinase
LYTYFLGVDLGGTHLRAAVVDIHNGNLFGYTKIATQAQEGYERVIERMTALITNVMENSGIKLSDIHGIGIGIPGTPNLETGDVIFLPNLPGQWRGVPLSKILQAKIGKKVYILNDVRSITLGEWKLGAGRGVDTLACYAIGTGIGGGVIVNSTLLLGLGGTVGELGHQIVEPNGYPCGCGGKGCLEMYASGPAIAAAAVKFVLQGHTTLINEICNNDIKDISANTVVKAALSGDATGQYIIRQAGKYLGIAVTNVIVTIGPKKVIFGGGVAEAGSILLDEIKKTVDEYLFMVPANQVEIVQAELGTSAGLIGAALWAESQSQIRQR